MSLLFLMIPISLLLGFGFLIGFIWSVKNNQYEDTETPAIRILFNENDFNIDKETK